MNENRKKHIWDELRLLQDIINKFDDITFKIKSWFITIFVAVTGYAVSQAKPALLVLNFLVIIMFYMYEVTYRLPLEAFLQRSREIQEMLRGEKDEKSNISPNLERYLFDTSTLAPNSKWLHFFLRRGIERRRAERNVLEWEKIGKRAYTFLFQLRISLIYLAAVVINVVALFFVL